MDLIKQAELPKYTGQKICHFLTNDNGLFSRVAMNSDKIYKVFFDLMFFRMRDFILFYIATFQICSESHFGI